MSIRKICRLGLAVVPGLLVAWGIAQAEEPQNILDEMNDELVAMGAEVRISKVEYVTTGENFQSGRTILVSDRGDKQFDEDFVPGDPRRGFRTDITWVIDAVDSATFTLVTPANQRAAIRRAMGTWDSVSCSDIPLTDLGDVGDVGALQFLLGFGGSIAGLIGFPAPMRQTSAWPEMLAFVLFILGGLSGLVFLGILLTASDGTTSVPGAAVI